MTKIPVRNEPIHDEELVLGAGAVYRDTYLYPMFIARRPTSVTIYNVSTADANWTRVPTVGTNLSNVSAWKLNEKSGGEFDYCFDGVGTTYMTATGSIQRDTEITAVWIRRRDATNLDMQLEIWA